MLLIGLVLLWFTRRQKTGKVFVTIGALALFLYSFPPTAELLAWPLEKDYAPLLHAQPAGAELVGAKWIVVLGAGHINDPRLPVNAQIGKSSLSRLVEALKLHRNLPDKKLVLSGGAVFEPVANAEVMAGVAESLGVARDSFVVLKASQDTETEVLDIKGLVGEEKFILVTSASHMRRALGLFHKQGMKPIPAPADFEVKDSGTTGPGSFFPQAENLQISERALYEYLGIVWAKLRGKI